MNEYDLRIKGLSKHRYRELRDICRQYADMKKHIAGMSVLKAARVSGSGGSGNVSDPVGEYVVNLRYLQRRIEAIDKAATVAASGSEIMKKQLLANVTSGVAYDRMQAACSRATFFRMRTAFFLKLDKLITLGQ